MPKRGPNSTSRPVSSRTSRRAVSSTSSPYSTKPLGMYQRPCHGSNLWRARSTALSLSTMHPAAGAGLRYGILPQPVLTFRRYRSISRSIAGAPHAQQKRRSVMLRHAAPGEYCKQHSGRAREQHANAERIRLEAQLNGVLANRNRYVP
jgi:hypothetical protein